jgi:AcrR family transcriptional regulator
MSTGALRHYFESQSELVTFAMASLVERVRARLAEVGARATDFEGVVALLEEVLPMDAQRQAESEVWLAFVAASRTEPSLRPLAEDAHRGLHSLCDSVVRVVSGAADDTPEFTTQVDALHGLVDGLAVQRTLFPKMLPRQRIRAVLRQYLTELAGRTGTV